MSLAEAIAVLMAFPWVTVFPLDSSDPFTPFGWLATVITLCLGLILPGDLTAMAEAKGQGGFV